MKWSPSWFMIEAHILQSVDTTLKQHIATSEEVCVAKAAAVHEEVREVISFLTSTWSTHIPINRYHFGGVLRPLRTWNARDGGWRYWLCHAAMLSIDHGADEQHNIREAHIALRWAHRNSTVLWKSFAALLKGSGCFLVLISVAARCIVSGYPPPLPHSYIKVKLVMLFASCSFIWFLSFQYSLFCYFWWFCCSFISSLLERLLTGCTGRVYSRF